jgi:hypothetical protein
VAADVVGQRPSRYKNRVPGSDPGSSTTPLEITTKRGAIAVTSGCPRFRLGSSLVSTVDSVRAAIAAFDAYASKDFDRLAELYAEDVTWCCRNGPGPWDRQP